MTIKLLDYKKIFLWLVIITTVITAGIDLYSYQGPMSYGGESIQRQYGNEIKLNMLSIVILAGIFLCGSKKVKLPRTSFILFVVYAIISLAFPNGQNRYLSIIGVCAIFKYYLLYLCLINFFNAETFKKTLDKIFKGVLVFETFGGILQVFFHIYIPFLTSRNVETYRGNTIRMCGTMLYSADFALLISLFLVYFLVEYLFSKKRHMIKYILISIFDLWFAGSRSLIIIVTMVFIYVFWKKYSNDIKKRMLIISAVLVISIVFINSSVFVKWFVNDNFVLMFSTRFIHWKIAYEIIIRNFFMGIGLNNEVSYVISNPDIVNKVYFVGTYAARVFYFTNPIHNSILLMFCELGIFGGVLYTKLMLGPIISNIKLIRKYRKTRDVSNYYIVMCAMLVIFVYALQGWGTLKEYAWVFFVLFLALDYMEKKKVWDENGKKGVYRRWNVWLS